uniref:Uncharacterized protein n=1 Tax=Arundo donax TaxID=35708 RepID=A0A0A9CK57_ARUDO
MLPLQACTTPRRHTPRIHKNRASPALRPLCARATPQPPCRPPP